MRLTRRLFTQTALASIAASALPFSAYAQEAKKYNVALLSDFSGPFADVMKAVSAGRTAVYAWWNAEIGKGLGIELVGKEYDTRYDAAQVASLWPGIVSELSPLFVSGVGTPDSNALAERLPDEKIPMFTLGGATHAGWIDDSWLFFPRATYAHEYAAFIDWVYADQKRTAPIKLGFVGSQQAGLSVDLHGGIEAYIAKNPDKAVLVDTIWDAAQPTDLTAPMRRLVNAGAEFVLINTNSAATVATKRALQALGAKIPVVTTSQNGMPITGKALGGLDQMEGDYEVYGLAVPITGSGSPAEAFYGELKEKYGLQAPWIVLTVMGMSQAMLSVRAVEAAAKQFGADKLTGENLRQAMLDNELTDDKGIMPNLKFQPNVTFPGAGATVNIGTVKDGKYALASANVAIPELPKW
jgi:branched-chain amino acid transport system substrate-binding protein